VVSFTDHDIADATDSAEYVGLEQLRVDEARPLLLANQERRRGGA